MKIVFLMIGSFLLTRALVRVLRIFKIAFNAHKSRSQAEINQVACEGNEWGMFFVSGLSFFVLGICI